MTPYTPGQDVFRTQADDRFNSFADPLNPVNTTPGNWGINPVYMTPSYMSPFRPQYQGPQGNMGGGFSPTWSQSMNFILNPFRSGGSNYGGNTWQQQSPFFDSAVNRPTDRALSFAQNWALPAGLAYGAFRGLEGVGSTLGKNLGGGLMSGMLGSYGSTGAGSLAISAGRTVGGIAGGFALPAMAAQVGMYGLNKTIFDPYIAQRQMSGNFRDNFAGVSFGQSGVSNQFTGGGISRGYAANMAGQMSSFAAQDHTFDLKEVGAISDLSSRAGLLDNANPSQMVAKLKTITRQVKLVMAVANTSDFREAIEILGKLQSAGATGTAASSTLGRLGGWSSAAGISTQRMMNTVGAQGQMLFGANGLTPFVGQTTAAQNYASLSSAFRSGLLSPALMARLGGVEGAAQSATSGMLGVANSPYASMLAQNAYMGGGSLGSVVGNVSKFGGNLATGGVSAIGQFNLNRPALMSRMLSDQGLSGIQDMISQIAQITPTTMKNGKVTAGGAMEILTKTLGVSDSEARSMLHTLEAYQNPGAVSQMRSGLNRAEVDSVMKFKEQQGLDYGMGTGAVQGVLGWGRGLQDNMSRKVSRLTGGMGETIDSTQDWWSRAKMGDAADMTSVTGDSFANQSKEFNIKGGFLNSDLLQGLDRGSTMGVGRLLDLATGGGNNSALEAINKAVAKGNPNAVKFINSQGEDREYALMELMKEGVVDKNVNFKGLLSAAEKAGVSTSSKGDINAFVNDTYGVVKKIKGGVIDKGRYAEIVKRMSSIEPGSEEYRKLGRELAQLTGKDPNSFSAQDISNELNSEDARKALAGGLMNYGTAAGVSSDKELDDLAKGAGGFNNLASQNLKGKFLDRYNSLGGGKNAYLASMQEQSGKALRGAKITNGEYTNTKDLSSIRDVQDGINKSRAQIDELVANNKIDFSDETAARAALDNLEASGKFSKAVEDFSKAVGAIGSGKSSESGSRFGFLTSFGEVSTRGGH